MSSLTPFVTDLWVKQYPVRMGGCAFPGRMTVVRLSDGRVLIHSPCPIDSATKAELDELGPVAFIVAPGNFHHLHVAPCQSLFPGARTYVCPGIRGKRPDLAFDGELGDTPEPGWAQDLDQVVVRGGRLMSEVAFFHRPSRTLILVDLIENMGDSTPGTNRLLRFFWKYVFGMWNVPMPAPEYRLAWKDKSVARESLERILAWPIERVLISHGEPLLESPRDMLVQAWRGVLRG